MPKQEYVRLSLLDRLIDEDPLSSYEPVQLRAGDLGKIKATVIRDLENLLNTRLNPFLDVEGCAPAGRSFYQYGFKDFSCQSSANPVVKNSLCRELEKTILLFEPRLKNVNAQVKDIENGKHNLQFMISALLVIEPLTEPVMFDTYFDPNHGEYVIKI
ncbi:MAG: type VI secretion system baseplate subunit TssE [Desulfobacteraceae bacterium]|nr:MAG: type VI secretion system baseplate subunit TssE [Desulfobacteraceae bacterium]